jgi:hypothetical protein
MDRIGKTMSKKTVIVVFQVQTHCYSNKCIVIQKKIHISMRLILSSRLTNTIEYSLRSAWAILVIMLLQYYWGWSDVMVYLSPIVSVITPMYYFGLWQESMIKAAYSTIIGSLLGMAVGYLHTRPFLVVILVFVSCSWIGTLEKWDRLSKVMATLGILLGSILPYTTNGDVIGVDAFTDSIALILLPFVIKCFTLLFPSPALAFFKAKEEVSNITKKVSFMTRSVIQAFISYDYMDLHCAEFNQLLLEINHDIRNLKQLNIYIMNEQLIFKELKNVPKLIDMFINVVELIIAELEGLRDMVQNILYNKTQIYFVHRMEKVLNEMNEEIEIILTIIREYFDLFTVIPDNFREKLAKLSVFQLFTPAQSFYSDPKCIEMIQVHKQKRRLSADGANNQSSNRDRSNSFELYGFHNYNLTEEVVIDDLEGQTGQESKTEKRGKFRFTGFVKGGSTQEFPVLQIKSKKELFRRLELEFDKSIHRLMSSRIDLLSIYHEIRKAYIFFDPREFDHILNTVDSVIQDNSKARKEIFEDNGTSIKIALVKLSAEVILNQSKDGEEHKNDLLQTPRRLAPSMNKDGNTAEGKAWKRYSSVWQQLTAEKNIFLDETEEDENILDANLLQQLSNEKLVQLNMREEIIRLSLRNLGPRGAFFHRLSILVEYLSSFKIIFEENEKEMKNDKTLSVWFSDLMKHYYKGLKETTFLYVSSVVYYFSNLIQVFFISCQVMISALFPNNSTNTSEPGLNDSHELNNLKRVRLSMQTSTKNRASDNYSSVMDYQTEDVSAGHDNESSKPDAKQSLFFHLIFSTLYEYFFANIQSFKIALAVAISSIIPVYNIFPSLIQRGMWTTIVVALIQDENISSSFLNSYQRLEGTVIGSIFSFIIYSIFQCNESGDNLFCIQHFSIQIIILVLWMLVCGLFRQGEQHGYSATVAAFTPFVLLLIPDFRGLYAAFVRIELTFIGIVIYLTIDLLVFPRRLYPFIKQSVLNCIKETKDIFQDSVKAVEILIQVESLERTYHIYDDEEKESERSDKPDSVNLSRPNSIQSFQHDSHQPPMAQQQQHHLGSRHSPNLGIQPNRMYKSRENSTGMDNFEFIDTDAGSQQENLGGEGEKDHHYNSRAGVDSFQMMSNKPLVPEYAPYILETIRSPTIAGAPESLPVVANPPGMDITDALKEGVNMIRRISNPNLESLANQQPQPQQHPSPLKLTRHPSVDADLSRGAGSSNNSHRPTITKDVVMTAIIGDKESMDNSKHHPSISTTSQHPQTSLEPQPSEQIVDIERILEIYQECKESLDKAEIQLKSMKDELTKQTHYLKTILYEPNLFFYNFPWSSYENLSKKFNNVYRSSLALNNGSRALIILICQMLKKKENIVNQLNHLLYMIRHLFLITSKSEIALNSAVEAFQK